MNFKAFYPATASCSVALLLFGGSVQAATVNSDNLTKPMQPKLLAQPVNQPATAPAANAIPVFNTINTRDLSPGATITLTGSHLDNIGEIYLIDSKGKKVDVLNLQHGNNQITFTVPNPPNNGNPPYQIRYYRMDPKTGIQRIDLNRLRLQPPPMPMPMPMPIQNPIPGAE
jgi:hypothetical protein